MLKHHAIACGIATIPVPHYFSPTAGFSNCKSRQREKRCQNEAFPPCIQSWKPLTWFFFPRECLRVHLKVTLPSQKEESRLFGVKSSAPEREENADSSRVFGCLSFGLLLHQRQSQNSMAGTKKPPLTWSVGPRSCCCPPDAEAHFSLFYKMGKPI